MIRVLFLVLLVSCSHYRMFKKDYITLSDSPCIDGTILNIDQAGCESFYWGTDKDGVMLKIRCTYAPKDSMWTRSTFYAIPHDYKEHYSDWFLFCEDRYIKMYSAPTGIRLDEG